MIYFRQNPQSPRHQGFTLVEILAICAIVAVLSTCLLSAFGRIRSNGRRASCASNLKQIGLASQMYASDHRGRYPNRRFAFGNPLCAWADILLPYTRSTAVFVCPASRNTPYAPGCGPNDPVDLANLNEFRSAINHDGAYDMNVLSLDRFINEAAFKHPATTISVLDGHGRFVAPAFTPEDEPAKHVPAIQQPRHGKGNNILFLDGHVKFSSAEALNDPFLWRVGLTASQ